MLIVYAKYINSINQNVVIDRIDVPNYPNWLKNSNGDNQFVITISGGKFSISGISKDFSYINVDGDTKKLPQSAGGYISDKDITIIKITDEEKSTISQTFPDITIVDLYDLLDDGSHVLHSCAAYTTTFNDSENIVSDIPCDACMIKWGYQSNDTCNINPVPGSHSNILIVFDKASWGKAVGVASITLVNDLGEIIGERSVNIYGANTPEFNNTFPPPKNVKTNFQDALNYLLTYNEYTGTENYTSSDGYPAVYADLTDEELAVRNYAKHSPPRFQIYKTSDLNNIQGAHTFGNSYYYIENGRLWDDSITCRKILKFNIPGYNISNNTPISTITNLPISGPTDQALRVSGVGDSYGFFSYGPDTYYKNEETGEYTICIERAIPPEPYFMTVVCGEYTLTEPLDEINGSAQETRMLNELASTIYDDTESKRRAVPGFDPLNDTTQITSFIFSRGDGSFSARNRDFGILYDGARFINYPGTQIPNPYNVPWNFPTARGRYTTTWKIPGWDGYIRPYFTEAYDTLGLTLCTLTPYVNDAGEDRFEYVCEGGGDQVEIIAKVINKMLRIPAIQADVFNKIHSLDIIAYTENRDITGYKEFTTVGARLDPKCYVYVSRGGTPPPLLPWLLPQFDIGGTPPIGGEKAYS